MLTRRCANRMFLLRPDDETNNAFLYCLIEAALRFNIRLILPQMMTNHHHTVFFDPDGNAVAFYQHFHTQMAKCQNALRGRWENLWSTEELCLVELMTPNDVIDELVYVATNPVKHGLVERVHHWPGPPTVSALLNGRPLRARRPAHYYRSCGSMPAEVEIALEIPPELGEASAVLTTLRSRIAFVEATYAEDRARERRLVLGRRRVLRQSWRDCPKTFAVRRNLRPRVAAKDPAIRVAALERNRMFQSEYREARKLWLRGLPALFPIGTYWLSRYAHVPVAAGPSGPSPLPN